MRKYVQVRLGKGNIYAEEALRDGYVGVGWFGNLDLTEQLASSETFRDFNRVMIPRYLRDNPETKKVAAGLFCGFTYTVCKDLQIGDIVLSPRNTSIYLIGRVTSGYEYFPGTHTPHRRRVEWLETRVEKESFSKPLRNSLGSIGTVSDVSSHSTEIERILSGTSKETFSAEVQESENVNSFALESHLENFLIENWSSTDFAKKYDIYQEGGEILGKQYRTDTGRIDILAISKDGKEFLVIELKKDKSADRVVGQVQRYMGDVLEEIAEEGQTVRGVIIALEDDLGVKRALSVTSNIDFYRYRIDFKLI